ncbi:hypothetical protein PCANC_22801 [Puccinia coronata f. sp. avenae]|uniref:Piwi domain-containing protein n=1 Tax=Puccinia coronata f. sp. avenae TaxID=200324 RepID=A0A2N5S029_9BASI|nr:hypothetical protein PCANC_22801 [Puccinia coronata f. sp. avenae]
MYELREDKYHKLHRVLRRFKIDIKQGDSDKGITKSINHLTLTNCQNKIFKTDEGRTLVEAFFLRNWGRGLHYPNLPNVVTMGKGKMTVYPMELCSFRKGQRYILKLGGDQQSSALGFQTIKPAVQFEQIMLARQNVKNSDHKKLLDAYGIRIEKQFLAAQAHVLPPPEVVYSANIRIPKEPPQLLLRITDERSSLYNCIKFEGNNFASRRVTTQCMVLKHVKTLKDQYISNLALKINLKIGGLNHCLLGLKAACNNLPTMIVGAYLTHNNLSAKMKPSIAAFVGSLDWTMLKYTPAVGVQPLLEPSDEDGRPQSQEPIQLFRTLLTELLEKWKKNNLVKKFPKKMIIFRDGVSDGEFTQVLESEFKAAKAAVEKLAGAPNQYNLQSLRKKTQSGLQGTLRPTRYVVLKGESNSLANQLQKIIQLSMPYSHTMQ